MLYVGLAVSFILLVIGGATFGESRRSKLRATSICLVALGIFLASCLALFNLDLP